MRIQNFASIILALAVSGPLCAQVILTRDLRPYRSVVSHLIADQTITAQRYTISFYPISELSPDGLAEAAMKNASQSALLDGATYLFGIDRLAMYIALKPVLVPIGAVTMAYNFMAMYGEIANTQSRTYQFYLPVTGVYRITCGLKGDWDSPRNRVRMVGPNGLVIDFSEQRSSDGDHDFIQLIEHGSYTLTVSLGSGSSSVFHTAGTLKFVQLDDSATRTWTAPIVVGGIRSALPANVGDNASFTFSFQGYPSTTPGLIVGSASYANLRPSVASLLGTLDGSPMGEVRAVNKPIRVISPSISMLGLPTFNGTTATFNVHRDADLETVLYPDDWYDQDGDGIPDPPM